MAELPPASGPNVKKASASPLVAVTVEVAESVPMTSAGPGGGPTIGRIIASGTARRCGERRQYRHRATNLLPIELPFCYALRSNSTIALDSNKP